MTKLSAAADSALDRRYMALALALAERGLGTVWPNPAVGCVLVQDGRIVGRGWTQPGGRPHAETEALSRAGDAANGATCYATLEPCAHHGQTGPCADALVQAGIARAVVATQDPDPRVAGRGLARLEAAGVEVTLGCMEDPARALNAGFLSRVDRGRPQVTLKLASSLDGRIATHTGDSRWITGATARARGHLLRARHDAVMVGAASALADDPALTCRLPGMADASPIRVVIDGSARLPARHALIADAGDHPTWIVSTAALGRDGRHEAWREAGVEVIEVEAETDGRPAFFCGAGSAGCTRRHARAGGGRRPARGLSARRGPGGSDRVVPGTRRDRRRRSAGAGRARYRTCAGHAPLRPHRLDPCWRGRVGHPGAGRLSETPCSRASSPTWAACRRSPTPQAAGSGLRSAPPTTPAPSRSAPPSPAPAPVSPWVDKGSGWFAVDVSRETAHCTTLGNWREGTGVNLERALALGDEIGGHLVTGHIDGVAVVERAAPEGESLRLTICCPLEFSRFVASKGSVALDGVSLTVNEVDGDVFGVNLIPHTLARDHLSRTAPPAAASILR